MEKEFAAMILDFRTKLKDLIVKNAIDNIMSTGENVQPHHLQEVENNCYLKAYDEYFGITIQKKEEYEKENIFSNKGI